MLLALTSLALLLLILSHAWVGEDALITFRTIENLVDGYGLRWNVDERVQSYTHPLWLLLNAAAYAFTREIFTTTTALGALCSVGAYAVLAAPFRRRPAVLLAGVFLPLCLSRSLIRYSTSGFENPLTLLLLAAFATLFLRDPARRGVPWLRLVLLASLAATNRLDAIPLLLPALLYLAAAHWGHVPWRRALLGTAPLAAWLLFSLFYYGFLFPNTAPAKLSAAIPWSEYLLHGLAYAADLVQADLASALILCAGAAITGHALVRCARDRGDLGSARLAALGLGIAPTAAYVVSIGGEFLSGRLWVAPVFLSVALIARRVEGAWRFLAGCARPRRAALLAGAGAAALALSALGRSSEAWTASLGILELPFARASLGSDLGWEVSPLGWRFRELGREAAREAERRGGRTVSVQSAIGFAGLAAGRDVLIIDRWAIADPLLARLAPDATQELRIGHLVREVPAGYERARQTGALDGMHPALREYYRRLRTVVAGPLWSGERLATIAGFQLGRYDAWLRDFEARSGGRGAVPSLGAWPARDRAAPP